jgi:prohibitin 2
VLFSTVCEELVERRRVWYGADIRAVDGGHRAIKYTRLGGVKKDIYNEGIISVSRQRDAWMLLGCFSMRLCLLSDEMLLDCIWIANDVVGTHFVIPWFETPITYDVRAKPRNVASLTGTKG